MSVNYNSRITTDGLFLYLNAFDSRAYSGSGNTWTDFVSKNNGNLINQPVYTAGSNAYFTFNGTNNEVTVTNASSGLGSQPLTVLGCFRTGTASGRKIIGFETNQTGTGSSGYERHFYVDTEGFLRFGIWTGSAVTLKSKETVNDNNWHFFAAQYNTNGSGLNKLYVDGSFQTSTTAVGGDGLTWVRIGGYKLNNWPLAGDGYFPGDISYLSVYNRILSEYELRNIYLLLKGRYNIQDYVPPGPYLSPAIFYLDAANTSSYPGTGNTWFDLTTNNHDGTISANGVVFDANANGCFAFDGVEGIVTLSPAVDLTSTDYTINMWIYPEAGQTNYYGSLFVDKTNALGLYRGSDGASTDRLEHWGPPTVSTTQLTQNVWNYITVVQRSGEVSLFINGTEDASTGAGQSYAADAIGNDDYAEGFKGKIAVVEVFDGALIGTQVATKFNETKTRFGL